ncbi:MAG: hypothetical protein JXB33_03260 [Clostridia bacterium]|nr:hypothetical protein [Clostridia bacterium]
MSTGINEPGPVSPDTAAADDLDKAIRWAYSAVRKTSFKDMLCGRGISGE